MLPHWQVVRKPKHIFWGIVLYDIPSDLNDILFAAKLESLDMMWGVMGVAMVDRSYI